MRIIVNTGSTLKGGAVQVANSCIHEFIKFNNHEYHVILGKTLTQLINPADFPENFKFYTLNYRPATKVFTIQGPDKFFKELEEEIKPDAVISMCGPAYWRPKVPHLMSYALPHYIYPESPFFKQINLYKRLKRKLKGNVIKYFMKRDADSYYVQTNDVNTRLRNWIGKKNVFTITNTISSYYLNPDLSFNKLPAKKDSEWRFLMLSAYYEHKNFEIIEDICKAFDHRGINNRKFVVTLPHETFQSLFSSTAQKFIHNVGPIKPNECPALYNECDFVFLPTLLECFSANYVEGMKMGKPILTSDLPFAHTVCKEAAIYFDPMDAHDIQQKMEQLLESPELISSLRAKGYEQLKRFNTAEERAESVLDLCESLIKKDSRN
jgi:glycosyltransferase involved in cell wall biosynthesis